MHNGQLKSLGNAGYTRSSRAGNGFTIFWLGFYGSIVLPSGSDAGRYEAFPLRCLARQYI